MYETKKLKQIKDNDEIIRFAVLSFFNQVVTAVVGFFTSCAAFNSLAPFGVSIAAAVAPDFIPACVIGCAAGYFYIYGLSVLTLRYIVAAALGGIVSYFLKRSFKPKLHRYFVSIASFFSVFVTGLILSMTVTVSADEMLLYGAEGGAAAVAGWFFNRFFNIGTGKRRVSMLTGSETAAVLSVFCVTLLALDSFPVSVFSLAVISGAYGVMVCATFGGDKYGALTGICAGVVLGFSHSDTFVTGGIALGGLLCGIFSKKNRFVSAVIFILSVALTAFTSDDGQSASYIIYDVGIAAMLLILTPKKLREIYSRVFSFADDSSYLSGQRSVLKTRLKTASDGMREVSSAVKAVGGIYRRRSIPKKESCYVKVREHICRQCDNYDECWNQNSGKTYKLFEDTSEAVMRNYDKNVPDEFLSQCKSAQRVMSELSTELERYRNLMREAAKTGDTVNIVSDQFSSISEVFFELSQAMDSSDEYAPALSEIAAERLRSELELNVVSCGVFRKENGAVYCELCFEKCEKIDYDAIETLISELFDIKFEKPTVSRHDDGKTDFVMCQKTRYRIESGIRQFSSDGGEWCGDTSDSFYDGKGKFYMILSDGMGTGRKAAADSVMCCSLCSSLLRAGFPEDAILKMINSAMLIRSGEESLATLDIAVVDLYDGSVCFYKAGASFSVAMKHLKMLKIEKPSLPVGILREIAFEKIEMNLRDGDAFVLISDGVPNEAVAVWRDILKFASDYDGEELADKLAKTAYLNSKENSPDDITVMTATVLINE